MKYLLVIAVIALVLWLARSGRRVPPPPPAAPKGSGAQDIVACAQCGLHLPRDEALPGRGGVFCGEDHRRAYEAAHPGS